MALRKYKVEITNGYVSSVYSTLDEYDWYGQLAEYPLVCSGYYKFVLDDTESKGHFEVDEDKKAEIEGNESKANEIAELKEKLNASNTEILNLLEDIISLDNALTFISDFIKLLVAFKKEHSTIIADRILWRARIKELEG